jgi:hypothetical protein
MVRLNGDAGRSWACVIETADSEITTTLNNSDLPADIEFT